jgi:hypothetical protein
MLKISRNIDVTVKNKEVKIDARISKGKFPPVKISGNFLSLISGHQITAASLAATIVLGLFTLLDKPI